MTVPIHKDFTFAAGLSGRTLNNAVVADYATLSALKLKLVQTLIHYYFGVSINAILHWIVAKEEAELVNAYSGVGVWWCGGWCWYLCCLRCMISCSDV